MKKFGKTMCSLLALGVMLSQTAFGTGFTSEAAGGTWKKDKVGWWYAYDDGTYLKNEWLSIGKKWYYFDAKGYMVTGWKKIDRKWYYFDKDGIMANGWKKIGGSWYYFAGGVMQTGWKKISSQWYYFDQEGVMSTGWEMIDSRWYFFTGDGIMVRGWKMISGIWYYFDTDGVMATGWKMISGIQYYFGTDGVMATGSVRLEGEVHFFDENGGYLGSVQDMSEAEVGDTVILGSYEQDNNLENGTEPIEWIVLDKFEDGSLYVVSKYALDTLPYFDGDDSVVRPTTTWETCTLRTWLNNDFLETAFADYEQNLIPVTEVKNEPNPWYNDISGGNDTEDRIFLMSYNEVQDYFGRDDEDGEHVYKENIARTCKTTPYAEARGAYAYPYDPEYASPDWEKYDGNCWWWLRSIGEWGGMCEEVGFDGKIDVVGIRIVWDETAVRPAMRIQP